MRRALAALAVLAVAGCGGGLSREEYDKRGEKVIAEALTLVAADKEAVRAHPRDPAVYRQLAVHLRKFADDLDAVGDPPVQLASRVHRIIDHMRDGAKLFDEAAAALAAGNIKTFQEKGDAALKTVNKAGGSGMFG